MHASVLAGVLYNILVAGSDASRFWLRFIYFFPHLVRVDGVASAHLMLLSWMSQSYGGVGTYIYSRGVVFRKYGRHCGIGITLSLKGHEIYRKTKVDCHTF